MSYSYSSRADHNHTTWWRLCFKTNAPSLLKWLLFFIAAAVAEFPVMTMWFSLLLSRLLFAAHEWESELKQAEQMETLIKLQELWLDRWCANTPILASVSYQCGIIERWHWINESHLVRIPICVYVLAVQIFCCMLPLAIHIIIHFVTCPELLRKQMAQDAGGAVVCVPQFYLFIYFFKTNFTFCTSCRFP